MSMGWTEPQYTFILFTRSIKQIEKMRRFFLRQALAVLTSGLLMFQALGTSMEIRSPKGETKPTSKPLVLEAFVDFVDDALIAEMPIKAQHIDAMMRRLKGLGVQRVSWSYYGDGHGGFLVPAGYVGAKGALSEEEGNWKNLADTYQGLGNPLKVAVEAGHRNGLEVYAYFKPYETGPSMTFPEGSAEAKSMGLLPQIGGRLAWLEPFVKAHPELRIQRRTDDLPADVDRAVVTTIRLIKQNDSPTRITKEHLQIWTSDANWQYHRVNVSFAFSDTVENSSRTVQDSNGKALTLPGQPVRVLTLSGLELKDKYVLITTDFADGKPDFVNAGTALVEVIDARKRVIPVEVATGLSFWSHRLQNFRTAGLSFDTGWGASPVALDAPNSSGTKGLIAFARGRNRFLPGPLCETEPRVQKFWMDSLEEMIAAGVDGVDFREQNHGSGVDRPEDYGFNEVILKRCGHLKGEALKAKIAEVRGRAYTDFLRRCKQRLAAVGKQMRHNLQVDWFRPDRQFSRTGGGFPANVNWEWQRWVDEKLMDAAILRFFNMQPPAVLTDPVSEKWWNAAGGMTFR